jgi:hypothetical protein
MTQTQAKGTTRRFFRVIGKDRLSDDWQVLETPDVETALGWAELRLFLLPDEYGNTVREVR